MSPLMSAAEYGALLLMGAEPSDRALAGWGGYPGQARCWLTLDWEYAHPDEQEVPSR